jgi:hypothetical protein
MWLLLLAACGATPGANVANHGADPALHVELVVTHDNTLRFVTVSMAGAVVTRSVTLPQPAQSLRVASTGPVVLLQDGTTVGVVTAKGYEPAPAFPPGTFDSKQPPGTEVLSPPRVTIDASTGDAWRGECHYGGIEDGGWCAGWVFAKIGSNPPEKRAEPDVATGITQLPLLPAPASPVVKIVTQRIPAHDDPVGILTCTASGRTVEYPAVDQRSGFFGMSDLVWIERDPPVFRATASLAGLNGILEPVYFEGCHESKRFAGASVETGPHDVIALVADDKLTLVWHGHEIGRLAGVSLLAFVW